MTITGTHIAYLHLCRRKLWLFANGINMEHTSDTVAEGKLIGETTYPERAEKFTEIEIDGIKIDFYDARKRVIHEVKKSNAVEKAHIAQVKYYIYKLRERGIGDVSGVIEYPKLKQREIVRLETDELSTVEEWILESEKTIGLEICPPVIKAKVCRSCSYHDFCYSAE